MKKHGSLLHLHPGMRLSLFQENEITKLLPQATLFSMEGGICGNTFTCMSQDPEIVPDFIAEN